MALTRFDFIHSHIKDKSMSGLWILLVLFIWGGITWLLWKVCNKFLNAATSSRTVRVGVITIVSLLWVGVSFWHAGGRKIYYDAQVNRMCGVDGGIKVYEKIKLPDDKFNRWKQPNFYKPIEQDNALGPEYLFKESKQHYQTGYIQISRYHYQVFRRSDGKLLGESISYTRGGGDLPGPWYPSSYSCPREHGNVLLLVNIFVSNEGDEQ